MELNPAWLRDAPIWAVLGSLVSAVIYWLQRVIRGDIKSDRRDKVADDVTANLMNLWQASVARADAALVDVGKMAMKISELEHDISDLRARLASVSDELNECNKERRRLLQDLRSVEAARLAARQQRAGDLPAK